MKSIKGHKLLIIIPILVCMFFSCKKEVEDPIPDVYVNLYLDISSTFYIELTSVGGWVNLTGGYKGIVVYRLSTDEFMAFERACPYDWQIDSAYVNVEPSGLMMKCNSCGSEFLIIDGSVVNGPSSIGMKQFHTNFDGQILHIYN